LPIYFVYALTFFNTLSILAGRIVLTLYALNLGARPFTIGMLATTYALFPMLLSWHSGRLSDRFGARWPLLFGSVLGALGMLAPSLFGTLPAVFVAAALGGLSLTFLMVCTQNLVGLMSSPEHRATNYGNYALANSISNFVAPPLAGFLIDHSGFTAACLYSLAISLVPGVLILLWGQVLPRGSGEKAPAGNVKAMLAMPGMYRRLTATSLLNTGQDIYRFYLPVLAHSLNLSASVIGVILAMNSAAAFFVRLVLARMVARFGEERVLAGALYVGGATLIVTPLFTGAVTLGVISFIFGMGMGCGQPIITMLMFTKSAEGRSGEAMGVRMTVVHITRLVGPATFGVIASAIGLWPIFVISGLMLSGGGALNQPRRAR
jgi:MFS family permease